MHAVKSTGDLQRDLLMDDARVAETNPIYCIYCTEPQRSVWKQPAVVPGYRSFQTGCLVADAVDVPPDTRRLEEIEEKCKPWHHLFEPSAAMRQKWEYLEVDAGDFVQFFSIRRSAAVIGLDGEEMLPGGSEGWGRRPGASGGRRRRSRRLSAGEIVATTPAGAGTTPVASLRNAVLRKARRQSDRGLSGHDERACIAELRARIDSL